MADGGGCSFGLQLEQIPFQRADAPRQFLNALLGLNCSHNQPNAQKEWNSKNQEDDKCPFHRFIMFNGWYGLAAPKLKPALPTWQAGLFGARFDQARWDFPQRFQPPARTVLLSWQDCSGKRGLTLIENYFAAIEKTNTRAGRIFHTSVVAPDESRLMCSWVTMAGHVNPFVKDLRELTKTSNLQRPTPSLQ